MFCSDDPRGLLNCLWLWRFPGFSHAPGSVGFERSVAACKPWSPGIFPALSSATISAPLSGIPRCNSVGSAGADGSAPRTLSAGSTASAADAAIASADPLDFRDDL
jgi:hypothetical protein